MNVRTDCAQLSAEYIRPKFMKLYITPPTKYISSKFNDIRNLDSCLVFGI